MQSPDWKQVTRRRGIGILVMVLGAVVLFMPIFVGGWVLAILGLVLIAAGLFQFVEIIRSTDRTKSLLSYLAGAVTILLGFVLFLSPTIALSGMLIAVTLFFLIDGITRVVAAFKQTGTERRWSLFNGLFIIVIALVIWWFVRAQLGVVVIGIALGLRLVMQGWTMFFVPERGFAGPDQQPDTRQHPDKLLRLEPGPAIQQMQEALHIRNKTATGQNIFWCVRLLLLFFVIHLLRTDAQWSFLGLISPFSALIGDTIVTLIFATVVVLPTRLLFRKLTRPFERTAWRRIHLLTEQKAEPTVAERVLRGWLVVRMQFAIEMNEIRSSMSYAFWRILRYGLALTALLIAVNSIWGFSWYFNSENWASGVWQQITKTRVDDWRRQMATDVEAAAISKGVPADKVFQVEPVGVPTEGDFSFIVIGDTGEGDPSQMSLRDQLIAAGKREEVKFLVLSSDVIYPDGKMKDYETNFYLPFKGFEKPIYAIPGNHDWFDANEGFNANFLDHDSAQLALRARLASDLKTKAITTGDRFTEMTNEAQRLRTYYGVKNGFQRGPFFEIHTAGFSLIAVDTGIMRSLDKKEEAWFEAALTRASNNFKMVVLGHPFYVAGAYQVGKDDHFGKIHETLKRFGVDVAMAGDTHDFEYYKEQYATDSKSGEMHHFVNGGGGAYLSIGTALGFPDKPATTDYAFYPRGDDLLTKIKAEAPVWKMPFVFWMRALHGYPFDAEMVSGAFDFNRAPFFQSFVQVNVERSQRRVRIQLYGVNGPLRWRDIQVGGNTKPVDKSDDDFVEFISPLHQ